MSPYIVDWDGRPIGFADYREMSIPQWRKFLEGWRKFLELAGPIRVQVLLISPFFPKKNFVISSVELGQEIVLVETTSYTNNWWYVSPEECRVRADRVYLKSSELTESDEVVYMYADVLSLGSIMNGAVL